MSALKSTAEKLAHMFGTERSLPICQEEKESVLLCYKQNSGESLKCSDAVKNFSRCVHSTRMVRFLHRHPLKPRQLRVEYFRCIKDYQSIITGFTLLTNSNQKRSVFTFQNQNILSAPRS